MMSVDKYMRASCPNCESQYAIDFVIENVNGDPEYCPFCAEEIPEADTQGDSEEEEGSGFEDERW